MSDNLTRSQRSYCMSRVKGKDTAPERLVRSGLHKRGYRFRKHVKSLPGCPDIVFPRARVVVFIDGDFWHGFRFPTWDGKLSSFWSSKIRRNRERDTRNFRRLRSLGWSVIRLWQHQIRADLTACVDRVEASVRTGSAYRDEEDAPASGSALAVRPGLSPRKPRH